MGRLVATFFFAVGLVGCASTSGDRLPAGDALEDPEERGRAPQDRDSAFADADDDLASAFSEGGGRKKGPRHDVKPPPPLVDWRQPYHKALEAARRAAGTPEAGAALAEAKKQALAMGPEERQAVAALALAQAEAGDDLQAVAEAALASLRACGPERAAACRREALAVLAKAAKQKDAPRALPALAKTLKEAEACVARAEKARRDDACLRKAGTAFAGEKDVLGRARIALVRAEAQKVPARRWAALEKVAKGCREAQCASLRLRALKALAAQAKAEGDTEKAARWALEAQAVHLTTLPEPQRRWGRTAAWDAACRAHDAKAGAGTCRALEKQVLGAYVFTDFSKQSAGEGLDGDTVRTVNAHYEPLLQPCLAQQARLLVPPDAMEFSVRWMVFNDGRVGEVHLRRDLDATPLARCLRGSFDDWRYPRYQGEWQHVEQKFTVRSTERRIGSR